MLFTIVLEFDGVNSVSQFSAATADSAFRKWVRRLDRRYEYGLTVDQARDLAQALASNHELHRSISKDFGGQSDELTPLMGLRNVWCVTASAGKKPRKHILLNIITTVSDEEKSAAPRKKSE